MVAEASYRWTVNTASNSVSRKMRAGGESRKVTQVKYLVGDKAEESNLTSAKILLTNGISKDGGWS